MRIFRYHTSDSGKAAADRLQSAAGELDRIVFFLPSKQPKLTLDVAKLVVFNKAEPAEHTREEREAIKDLIKQYHHLIGHE
jgi:hypothetical protein